MMHHHTVWLQKKFNSSKGIRQVFHWGANNLMMITADSSQTRIWDGWWSVLACLPVAVVYFFMHIPYCSLDRWRFGPRMVGRMLALSASFIFPLQLYASLPQTYDWLFSLMSTICLGLRPPAAMTDGWFPPAQAVSSADLCNAFLKHHDTTFLLGAHLKWPSSSATNLCCYIYWSDKFYGNSQCHTC